MIMPLTPDQRQLVEDSMEMVPKLVSAMTRTCAYVTHEEREELCQIGYLALCRAASKTKDGKPFAPYAKTAIRHAIIDYWRSVARDKDTICSFNADIPETDEMSYEQLLPDCNDTEHPDNVTSRSAVAEYLREFSDTQCDTIKRGITSLWLQQQGYTSFDLARHYQVPPNRVRAWKSKARNLLRQDQNLYAMLT